MTARHRSTGPRTRARPRSLRVGIAAADITPEAPAWLRGYGGRRRPSEGVARPILAQCVVFDNGQTRVAFVAVDLLSVSYRQLLKLRAAAEAADIPQQHLMINVSHTHYGPSLGSIDPHPRNLEYDALFTERTQRLFSAAVADLQPALLDYTVGFSTMGFNRCSCYAPGGRRPIDPDVPVLRVLDAEGQVRAVILGYACHPTTANGPMLYLIGTDYPGYARDWVAAGYPGATAIFLQGCGGDVKPGVSADPRSVWWRDRLLNAREAKAAMGYELGRAVIRAVAGHGTSHPVPPPQAPADPPAGRTRASFERERGFPVPPPVPADRPTEPEQALAAPVLLGGIVEVVPLPSKADPEQMTRYPWHVGAWRIGDLYFFGAQGEVLSAIGMRIKRELADLRVWTNG